MIELDFINTSRLGIIILDAILDIDNLTATIGTSLVDVIKGCTSDREYKTADDVVKAITGCSIKTLIERNEGETQ